MVCQGRPFKYAIDCLSFARSAADGDGNVDVMGGWMMGGCAGGGDLAVPSPGPPPLRMVPGLMLIAPHRLTHDGACLTGNVSVESSVCKRRCVGDDVSSHRDCLPGDQFVFGMSSAVG
jgi:hypothetical protein